MCWLADVQVHELPIAMEQSTFTSMVRCSEVRAATLGRRDAGGRPVRGNDPQELCSRYGSASMRRLPTVVSGSIPPPRCLCLPNGLDPRGSAAGCFVAILVAAGCNVREVSEWAGHNSVAFALTRSGGLFEDDTDAAVKRPDDLLKVVDTRP